MPMFFHFKHQPFPPQVTLCHRPTDHSHPNQMEQIGPPEHWDLFALNSVGTDATDPR